MLGARQPSRGLELMRQTGLLGEVIPELLEGVGCTQNRFHKHDVFGHTLSVVDATQGDAVGRLGALLHDVGKPRARQPREGAPGEYSFFKHEYVGAEMAEEICRRLKLANADRDRVVAMVKNHMFFYMGDWSDGTIRRFVRRVGGQDGLGRSVRPARRGRQGARIRRGSRRGAGRAARSHRRRRRRRRGVEGHRPRHRREGRDANPRHRPGPRDRRDSRAAAGAGARRSVAQRAREAGGDAAGAPRATGRHKKKS